MSENYHKIPDNLAIASKTQIIVNLTEGSMTEKIAPQRLAEQIKKERLCKQAVTHDTPSTGDVSEKERMNRCMRIPLSAVQQFLDQQKKMPPRASATGTEEGSAVTVEVPSLPMLTGIMSIKRG
jgi:hypothetical protein